MAVKTDAQLKSTIDSAITTNGLQEITGAILNGVQTDIIDSKVSMTDAETIAGVKTFSSSPIVPAPTTDYQAATKKYVDDNSPTVTGLVPYTGATGDVDLGGNKLTVQKVAIGDYSGGNYAAIDSNGEIRLYGEATQWEDLRVPVISTKAGGTKDPDWVKILDDGLTSQGVFTYAFDDTSEEELYFAVQMPHSWKQGSTIEAHVHWIPFVAGTLEKDVAWGLEYTWANIGSVFSNTTMIAAEGNHLSEYPLVAKKHYLTELGTIDATGMTLSSMLICRVFRDATSKYVTGGDGYVGDAGLLEIDFHYQVDSMGSNEEYIKY